MLFLLSHIITMAAINHFRNALHNTCGMTQAAANAIISQGFKDPASLIPMEEDDIDSLVKHTLKAQVVLAEGVPIMIPYNAVIKLKAFSLLCSSVQKNWAASSQPGFHHGNVGIHPRSQEGVP